jgi:hypothetical protein
MSTYSLLVVDPSCRTRHIAVHSGLSKEYRDELLKIYRGLGHDGMRLVVTREKKTPTPAKLKVRAA